MTYSPQIKEAIKYVKKTCHSSGPAIDDYKEHIENLLSLEPTTLKKIIDSEFDAGIGASMDPKQNLIAFTRNVLSSPHYEGNENTIEMMRGFISAASETRYESQPGFTTRLQGESRQSVER